MTHGARLMSVVCTNAHLQDVRLRKGGSVTIPVAAGLNTFVYAHRGGMTVGGKAIKEGQMAMLGDGDQVKLSAPADAGNALVIGGKPINEPVARYGPFVMNTRVSAWPPCECRIVLASQLVNMCATAAVRRLMLTPRRVVVGA